MFGMEDYNPLIFDLFIFLVLIGLIIYFIGMCCISQSKYSKYSVNRQRNYTKSTAFYLGIVSALLYNYISEHGHLGKRPRELWRVTSKSTTTPDTDADSPFSYINSSVFRHITEKREKVVFITTTKFNMVQPAVLTKIGQALFPVRDSAIWVVVSTTKYADFYATSENSSSTRLADAGKELIFDDAFETTNNETLMTIHLQSVEERLKRFGVSYVLMQAHEHLEVDLLTQLATSRAEGELMQGLLTGLIWSLHNFKRGVIMLAHQEYTYNYRIFQEVIKTKIASTWPVGLQPSSYLGFSSPIVGKGDSKVIGYHDGDKPHWDKVLMEVGAFAVNIEHARNNLDERNLWKMVYTGSYTMDSIGIKIADVEALGEKATKILVWRTKTYEHPWPTEIKIKPSFRGTNMFKLFKHIYGVKFPFMAKNLNYTEKIFKVYI